MLYSDQGYQGRLRQQAVARLERSWTQLGATALRDQDKAAYLAGMQRAGQPGGEPEVRALCRETGATVELVLGGLRHPVQVRAYTASGAAPSAVKPVVRLVFVADGADEQAAGHYDLAVETVEEVAAIDTVYRVARDLKVRQMREWPAYRDNTLYG